MAKVYEFLANGFEEIEGLAPVDILRRGGVEVKTVSITGSEWVETAHGITLKADLKFEDVASFEDADMLLLPGGMPGSTHLNEHEGVRQALIAQHKAQGWQANWCHLRSSYGSGKHRHSGGKEGYLLSRLRAVFRREHRIHRYPLPGRWQRDYGRRSCRYPSIRLQDIELFRKQGNSCSPAGWNDVRSSDGEQVSPINYKL